MLSIIFLILGISTVFIVLAVFLKKKNLTLKKIWDKFKAKLGGKNESGHTTN